ncbi:uncharacterized protein MONBRDRAFT_37497 [Monosiga brevicollis MX1]|uniref:NmrA-like domain-containing protein n=1 Tax=Monosiga brevicollis TaxID=81824 RepID=A9V236_MONBE|nr:uncharacterized protein MONBRDRAFT_37497 [Monosiga brevicollis MX1]EDQ88184.1 predicted protein [Monosiga brevicollis MX1]|eukprot:XP_001746777.1 hypothetical protein [Monosiga brevicollis MX1]
MAPTVAILSANSNTGTAAIECLTEQYADKVKVRGVVRRMQSAADVEEFDIEVVKGDVNQPHMLGPVFEGVNAAYFAVPTSLERVAVTKKFIDACFTHGVQHAVILSVLQADRKETKFQQQFAEIEEYAMSKAGKPVNTGAGDTGSALFVPVILRCAPFYQNMYSSLRAIEQGTLTLPLGDHKYLPHVDVEDVAACIAAVLAEPSKFAAGTYNLIGEYQAGNQIATAIAMKAGVQCNYQAVTDDEAVTQLEQNGLAAWIAKGQVETMAWFREGSGQDIESDVSKFKGSKPAKFGDFVATCLKPMLN